MILINNCFAPALSDAVDTDPVCYHALNQDFVLFRDAEQKANCLSGICVH